MSKSKHTLKQWLPLALVPMMSIAVLQGCSSDDDPVDDTPATTGSTDGGTAGTGGTDGGTAGTAGTGGTDGGTAGTGGTDGGTAGTGGTDGGTTGTGGTDGGTTGTGGTDGGTTGGTGGTGGGTTGGSGGDGTGSLGTINIGADQGTVDLSWDGNVLSGTVTAAASAGATSAALYEGIAAATADPGIQRLQLSGAAPNFSFPIGLSADQAAPVKAAMASGNLYIVLETAAGQVRSEQLLPPGGAVVATFTSLTSSDTTVFSNGESYLNINTNTGDYSTFLSVNLNPSDTDSAGNAVTLSAATINRDSIAGTVMVQLNDTGNSTTFKSTGQLSAADLQIINANGGWFQVYQNDGTIPGPSFLSGQIQVP